MSDMHDKKPVLSDISDTKYSKYYLELAPNQWKLNPLQSTTKLFFFC
jgi:hypothetical protein